LVELTEAEEEILKMVGERGWVAFDEIDQALLDHFDKYGEETKLLSKHLVEVWRVDPEEEYGPLEDKLNNRPSVIVILSEEGEKWLKERGCKAIRIKLEEK